MYFAMTLQYYDCTVCPGDQFRCHNTGRCILRRYVCDLNNDCGDRSDERNCALSYVLYVRRMTVKRKL